MAALPAGEDHTSTVLGVIIFCITISSIVVGARLYVRSFVRRTFGLDDTFMAATLVLFLLSNILILVAVRYGFGRADVVSDVLQYQLVSKLEILAQFFTVIAYAPAKASVAICIGRIFLGRRLLITLWTISILNVAGFTGMGVFLLAQCTPAAKQWNPAIDGSCLPPEIYTVYCIVVAAIGAASDFALALIPWYYIARLQMRRRERFAVGVAMSFGVVAGIFAIVKTVFITELNSRTNYAFDTIPLILWACGEQCAIMIAASIPMLRPMLKLTLRKSSNPQPSDTLRDQQRTGGKKRKDSGLSTFFRISRRDRLRNAQGSGAGSESDVALNRIWAERTVELSSSLADEQPH